MPRNIEVRFGCDGRHLLRYVTPRRGRPYIHSCDKATFEEVLHRCGELECGITIASVVRRPGGELAFSAVATALAFLYDRGILGDERGRTMAIGVDDVYLDGMTEFHALHEEATQ